MNTALTVKSRLNEPIYIRQALAIVSHRVFAHQYFYLSLNGYYLALRVYEYLSDRYEIANTFATKIKNCDGREHGGHCASL